MKAEDKEAKDTSVEYWTEETKTEGNKVTMSEVVLKILETDFLPDISFLPSQTNPANCTII